MFKKKKKYVESHGLMGNADDYHVYHMRILDYLIGFGMGFAGVYIIMFVFFRIMVLCMLAGAGGGLITVGYYRTYLLNKRQRSLLLEFRDLLEALTTSFSSGKNTMDAFSESYQDLMDLYGDHADIVKELRIILGGIANNFAIENMLTDFADRSGLDDVSSFATIFESCNRQGGNIKQIVWDSRKIINDKIEIEMEIKTMLTEKENELNIMMVMPLVIMLALNGLGTGTAVANTFLNVVIKLIAIGIFGAAYLIGRKIVKINI